MEPYEWVNNLKLKFSYGEQGNDGIPDFLYRDTHLDMVSFGPTLQGVHSPSERMYIPAVERYWGQLTRILAKVADLKK